MWTLDRFALSLAVGLTLLVVVSSAGAQQVFVYPQKGQNSQQQAADQGQCQQWAQQQTGYNPMAPPPPPQGQGSAPQGEIARGAMRGAAVGAVGGAIGGDAGKGAAIGAAAGGLFGGMRRNDRMRQEEAQMANYQAQTSQAQATFNRAYAACLTGRGYTVQ
jgi:outer membrane protein with glycine zipper